MNKIQEVNLIQSYKNKFEKIISKHLEKRGENANDFNPSSQNPFYPNYIMKMCEELNEMMPKDMLKNILDNETYCMGHSDYSSKLSLYCAELFVDAKKEK